MNLQSTPLNEIHDNLNPALGFQQSPMVYDARPIPPPEKPKKENFVNPQHTQQSPNGYPPIPNPIEKNKPILKQKRKNKLVIELDNIWIRIAGWYGWQVILHLITLFVISWVIYTLVMKPKERSVNNLMLLAIAIGMLTQVHQTYNYNIMD